MFIDVIVEDDDDDDDDEGIASEVQSPAIAQPVQSGATNIAEESVAAADYPGKLTFAP